VMAPKENRVAFFVNRSNLSQEVFESIAQAQWNDDKKMPLATYTILNDGDVEHLNQSANSILQRILSS
jgi:dephospho-CoA kinase